MFKSLIQTRSFSSSALLPREWKHVISRRVAQRPTYEVGDERPKHIPNRQLTPDYKYGESSFFKRSNKGLFGGSFIKSGHRISEMRQKSNRFWKPNAHKKSLWSETLQKPLKFQVTAKVLKTIDREGGLDNYLTKDKSARIKELGPFGWKLRYQILKKKQELANPPHKDAKSYSLSNGETGKIYYENVLIEGVEQSLNVKIGRRKLLKELYNAEKKERKALGEDLDGREFHDKFRELPATEILKRLANYGYDFKAITV